MRSKLYSCLWRTPPGERNAEVVIEVSSVGRDPIGCLEIRKQYEQIRTEGQSRLPLVFQSLIRLGTTAMVRVSELKEHTTQILESRSGRKFDPELEEERDLCQ